MREGSESGAGKGEPLRLGWSAIRPTIACGGSAPICGPEPDRSALLGPPAARLPTPQRQQLGVGGKDLRHRLLELAPLFDQRTDLRSEERRVGKEWRYGWARYSWRRNRKK